MSTPAEVIQAAERYERLLKELNATQDRIVELGTQRQALLDRRAALISRVDAAKADLKQKASELS